MRKLLVLALLMVPVARADTIVNATVGFTPVSDPLASSLGGGVGVSWGQGTTSFNAFVFRVVDGPDPFTLSGSKRLDFIPGTYTYLDFEIMKITSVGPRTVDFFFEHIQNVNPLPGETQNIITYDFKIPVSVKPILNTGTEGDRYYIDNVAMDIGALDFVDPPATAASVNFAEAPVSTPEPATLVLLLAGLLFLAVRRATA